MLQKFGYLRKPFLIWFSVNMLGFGALGASILLLPALLGVAGFYITTFIMAIPISVSQWIVLQRILPTSKLWTLTIPTGIPMAFLIMRVIPAGLWFDADDDSLVAITSMLLVVGFVIGLLQWLLIRRQLARAAIWLWGSAIGVAGSFWLVLVTGLIDQSGIISYIVVAFVYAGVTGLFLSWLLAYNHQSQTYLVNAT